jgi:hypothetical protein
MKHLVLQAIQDSHDSPIKPDAFYKIVKDAVTLLAALETTVTMTTMLAMIEVGMPLDEIRKGIGLAAMVTTNDALRMHQDLDKEMRLVQQTRLRDPLKVN